MDNNQLEKRLKKVLDKYIKCDEYQDKYFLWKEIKKAAPELPDSKIHNTINACMKKLKSPIKRDDLIKSFLN